MTVYKNSLEHLIEELSRIELIVSLNLEKYKAEHTVDEFQGLYISEKEVNTILKNPPYEFKADWAQQLLKIEALSKAINEKKAESLNQGIELRLQIISELFKLKPIELDAMLICMAPELDMRYEKLYSYLQDDVTKKRPSAGLIIKLLSSSMEEGFKAREIFSPYSPLIKNHLIYLAGEAQEAQIPLLSRSIKVDERIISFLLGSDLIDPGIRNFSKMMYPKKSFNDLILEDDNKNELIELIKRHSGHNIPLIFYFHGQYGTGKKLAAEAICTELRTTMLLIDSKALIKDESLFMLDLILREAQLQNSSVYFERIDVLWKEKEASISVIKIFQALDSFPNIVFMSGEETWEPSGMLKNHVFISIAFPVPSYEIRKSLWSSFLNGNASNDVQVSALASKFKFSGGQIKDAILTSSSIAMIKKPAGSKLSVDELYEGCKAQSNKNLILFAKKIEPHYTWNDIILPDDIKQHLKEISGYIKYRGIVYTNWGFDKKLSLGKGLNVIFSGPSGTGKTMTAEIIAMDAKLDLYKIDLSSVVSKYIGETEKNLKNIFKEAETSNAILFFDEADALFGKRSEVKDAHDRYANIETGYLLQKMEEYEGVVILATNLSKNIDDAFLRRMQYVIDFPFPDENQRKVIWKGIFPKEAPIADDIDFKFAAEKLILAGGNIKNIALSAAFYAAQEACEIGMSQIMHAAKREYHKIGKPFLEDDFQPYYKMIKADEK